METKEFIFVSKQKGLIRVWEEEEEEEEEGGGTSKSMEIMDSSMILIQELLGYGTNLGYEF